MKTFLIRGVPLAMQQDGWWMSGEARQRAPDRTQATGHPDTARLALLVALIALGDILVWQVMPGLSLAVFGAVLVLAALWIAGAHLGGRRITLVAGGTVLTLLPLVELVQPLSLLIAISGLSAVLAMIAGLHPSQVMRAALRLWPLGVRQTCVDATGVLRGNSVTGAATGIGARLQSLVMGWFVPAVLGAVFVLLLLAANPIAQGWADAVWRVDIDLPGGDRMLFWALLVPLIWTALSLHHMRERLRAAPPLRQMGPSRPGLINPASVTRALVLFNLIFAVQTGLDLIYLYGDVGLPDGITYAQYAHRGAYPLVVTALLAGGFALITRAWTDGNAVLRALLMIWVAQNVMLVVSSLVRLELYVGVYGLTHLRVAAAIWMALVAGGLALILWQVWRGHRNGWLILRGGAMAAVTLYACAWISFDAVIARHNLNGATHEDTYHLCQLGDAAKPVIARHEIATGRRLCAYTDMTLRTARDWREWGFRNWRAHNSLSAIQAEVAR